MRYRTYERGFRRARLSTQCVHFSLCLFVSALLAGCAVAPQPIVDVYMEPIEGRFNAHVDTETGAMTVEQKGVVVTIEPLDEVEIFALTDDPRINPYLLVERGGAVEPIYTVFEITVHNLDNPRVLADETAVLMDGSGTQYANLPSDYFEGLYDNVDFPQRLDFATTTYPYYSPYRGYYPYYRPYRTYLDVEALEEGRIVIEDSIFEGGKLFPGAKRRGLLIFDRLNVDATDVRIIVPDIRRVHSNGKQDKLEFKFDFRQVVAVK